MKGSSGQRFGKYQIEYELGRGGFGTVFRALDTTLDRPVAIKILDLLLMRDRDWVARFQREARLMARLDHPHVVQIYETGNLEGRLFIAMKLVDGPDLARHLVSTGPVPWKEALSLVGQIAEALDYAHAAGLVHRDLKPSNVLLAGGKAILTDFGLSMLASSNTMSASLTGGLIGTPAYIAPEAWEGREVTAAADQYALACLVYEMLTGHILFRGETPPAIMKSHYEAPRFPEAWAEGIPLGIGEVLATALTYEPEERYTTCGGFAEALHRLQADNLARPYAKLQAAVREEQWPVALTLAAQIRDRDENYRDVAGLEEEALAGQEQVRKVQLAQQWRAQAEEALSAGNVEVARTAAIQWQQLSGDAEAGAFLAALDQPQADEASAPQADRPELALAPVPEQQAWRAELVTKEWYARKIRVFLTNDVHVIDAKRPLGKSAIVELDGEVVAENEETPWLSWEGTFHFVIADGNVQRSATVELGTHWFHDKITKCRLIVDDLLLYDEVTA